jgi:hypothetical protein
VLFSMRFFYELKTITRDSNAIFCFVRYGLGKVFQEKKIETITMKIRTNCKNYNNFYMHSGS